MRRSSPLVFCAPVDICKLHDQHPHPHFRQPQRAAAEAVRRGGPADQRAGTRDFRALRRRARGEDRGVQGPRRAGRSARRAPARGLRRRPRGRQARVADAPFRRAADRRHGAPQRQDRRNADGRRQDARRHAADLPERARRQRRPSRHRQRLSRATRRGLDGADLPLAGDDGRRQSVADGPRGQAGGVRVRHHLRHEQRIRLRLPARQHGVRGVAARPARPLTTRSSTKSTRS